ncbi:MAG: DHHA1 domain-containing protein [Candidatus Thorarchaeota archaeon]
MKIATHTDFDGICCAALFFRKFGFNIEIIYATVKEAKDFSNSRLSVDYTCDLPKISSSINIDHHKSNYEELKESNRLSERDIVDPTASSATDLVFMYLGFENDLIAEEIRELGHLADIAQLPSEYHQLDIVLSMNNDDSTILRLISELLAKKGRQILSTSWLQVKYSEIQSIYEDTQKKIKNFLKRTPDLPQIVIFDTRQAICNKLAKEVFRPLFERNVAVIALVYSKSAQEPIRVSFRVTKAKQSFYDVSTVARAFGGGGHTMAAACSLSSAEIPDKLKYELLKIAQLNDTIQYLQL